MPESPPDKKAKARAAAAKAKAKTKAKAGGKAEGPRTRLSRKTSATHLEPQAQGKGAVSSSVAPRETL